MRVAQRLQAIAVEHFLPQYKDERRWSDRSVELMLPLFPGYIFVRVAIEKRLAVLETPGVIYLVGAREPEPLEDEEIEQLKNICANGHTLKPLPHVAEFKSGDRVRVIRGPLAGYVGYLSRTKKGRVVLVQHLTQQSISVEVPDSCCINIQNDDEIYRNYAAAEDAGAGVAQTAARDARGARGAAREEHGSSEGLDVRSSRVAAAQTVSEKPHAFARTAAHAGSGGVGDGESAESAQARQGDVGGDPCLGDGVPGVCPPRVPASSVGTPN
jgi:transcription antitermination factor NusG